MEDFLKVMANKQPSIRRRLSEATAQQIAINRQKLHSIVETIVLCGWQNIALRGHQDSTMDVENAPNAQHGNFQAFLQFRVSAGDTVLTKGITLLSLAEMPHTPYASRIRSWIFWVALL